MRGLIHTCTIGTRVDGEDEYGQPSVTYTELAGVACRFGNPSAPTQSGTMQLSNAVFVKSLATCMFNPGTVIKALDQVTSTTIGFTGPFLVKSSDAVYGRDGAVPHHIVCALEDTS